MNELVKTIIENATNEIKLFRVVKENVSACIKGLILAIGGSEPICFNDETGFPSFWDTTIDEHFLVVGVMVRNGTLLFNTDCGNDDYGLDPDGWFIADYYGTYEFKELLDCIVEAINHK